MAKRGQVTIFMIIAVIIISVVGLFFILRGGIIPGVGESFERDSNAFLQVCIEDKLREGIELISLQGGYIENSFNVYFKFDDESKPQKISYLCYTSGNSVPCINQNPLLIRHLDGELKKYISEEMKTCFEKGLKKNLERQGYEVVPRYKDFDVDLNEHGIGVNLDAEIILTKEEETMKQENFNLVFQSKFYDLGIVAQRIIGEEVKEDCVFDPISFGIYPDMEIKWTESKTIEKDYRIYRIKHLKTQEGFRFAVRGCVI